MQIKTAKEREEKIDRQKKKSKRGRKKRRKKCKQNGRKEREKIRIAIFLYLPKINRLR